MPKSESRDIQRPASPCVQDCIDRCAGCAVHCAAWKAYVMQREEYYRKTTERSQMDYATEATIRAFRRADRRAKRQSGQRFSRKR